MNFGLVWYFLGNYLMHIMKQQCFLVWKDRRGRGVTVLSLDKTECRAGVGGGGEYRKMGHLQHLKK